MKFEYKSNISSNETEYTWSKDDNISLIINHHTYLGLIKKGGEFGKTLMKVTLNDLRIYPDARGKGATSALTTIANHKYSEYLKTDGRK